MTNLEAKQEAIKKAYGEYYIHADINGWIKYGMYCPSDFGIEDYDELDTIGIWRCKSLKGIENNNGWTRIESEADLPKEGNYFVVKNKTVIETSYFMPDNDFSLIEWRNITHYQPIEKPKPPIY